MAVKKETAPTRGSSNTKSAGTAKWAIPLDDGRTVTEPEVRGHWEEIGRYLVSSQELDRLIREFDVEGIRGLFHHPTLERKAPGATYLEYLEANPRQPAQRFADPGLVDEDYLESLDPDVWDALRGEKEHPLVWRSLYDRGYDAIRKAARLVAQEGKISHNPRNHLRPGHGGAMRWQRDPEVEQAFREGRSRAQHREVFEKIAKEEDIHGKKEVTTYEAAIKVEGEKGTKKEAEDRKRLVLARAKARRPEEPPAAVREERRRRAEKEFRPLATARAAERKRLLFAERGLLDPTTPLRGTRSDPKKYKVLTRETPAGAKESYAVKDLATGEEIAKPGRAAHESQLGWVDPHAMPSVDELVAMASEASSARHWYEQAADVIWSLFGKDAEIFAGLLAATSANREVGANVSEALKGYIQYLNDEPYHDLMQGHVRNAEMIREVTEHGGEPVVPVSGPKVDSFYNNMIHSLFGLEDNDVTVDIWMYRLLYGVDAPSTAGGAVDEAKAIEMKKRASDAVRAAARKLGWSPRETQAALWAYAKMRLEWQPTDPRTGADTSYGAMIERYGFDWWKQEGTHRERLIEEVEGFHTALLTRIDRIVSILRENGRPELGDELAERYGTDAFQARIAAAKRGRGRPRDNEPELPFGEQRPEGAALGRPGGGRPAAPGRGGGDAEARGSRPPASGGLLRAAIGQ